jgi:quinoprotein glucose dehydrogenase
MERPTGKTIVEWTVDRTGGGGGSPANLDGLSIWKGPYGRITAIDLNTGDHLWVIPHGDAPDNVNGHPLLQGLNVPNPGRSGHSAMMVTSTLLFATGSTSDNQPHLFAIDKRTGERLGKVRTPAMGQYGLMSYMHQGRQYIVLPVTGGYTALALPETPQ